MRARPIAVVVALLCLHSVQAQTPGGEPTGGATSGPDNGAYWESVFTDNRVLEIQVNLTREAWDAMQPPQSERGGRGRGRRQRGRQDGPPGGNGRGGPLQRGGEGPPDRGEGPPNGGPPGAGGDSSEYTYVKADITIDGQGFGEAGLRFKGNSSYRSTQGGMKRPLKIDLDKFVDGQRLHGRAKLNLSNSFLDSAFMKEQLAAEVYESAGVPAAGVGWANVTLSIDGERHALGIYVLVEQVGGGFVKRRFGKASKGSLLMKPEVRDITYLGDDPAAYGDYHIKSGEGDEEQFAKFTSLLQWLESASDDEFGSGVGERLDLRGFASYLAATSALSSIDSFVGMPHNYYLLLDKADGKLKILPWDLNEGFGTFAMGSSAEALTRWDIDRPWTAQRQILERLFATEAFPKMYRAALEALIANGFSAETLGARITKLEDTVAPFMATDSDRNGLKLGIHGADSGYNTAVQRRTLGILPFITKRIASVQAQLAGEEEGETVGRGRRR